MYQIEEWLNSLRDSEALIIVEGKKDLIALNKLGIFNVITLSKSLCLVVEDVAKRYSQAVILTDLDKEGQDLCKKLKHGLQRHGVKVNTRFREFLFTTRLTQIEGIASYLKNNFNKLNLQMD